MYQAMSQQTIPHQLLYQGEEVHGFATLEQSNKHISVFYFLLTWVNKEEMEQPVMPITPDYSSSFNTHS